MLRRVIKKGSFRLPKLMPINKQGMFKMNEDIKNQFNEWKLPEDIHIHAYFYEMIKDFGIVLIGNYFDQ